MKKALPLSLAFLAFGGSMFAQSEVKNQERYGVAVASLSDNGVWMVSEMDGAYSMKITNLATGMEWPYIGSENEGATQYTLPFTRAASDEGVVVGKVNNIPSYWVNGKWTQLGGWYRDDSGYVRCTIAGITPDGSLIVGSLGKGASAYDDVQMTYPCIWERRDDGTYGDAIWLPNPEKDVFDAYPQYVNPIAVSQDGNTVAVMMRCGSGMFQFPYVYTRDDAGEWSYKALGLELFNPRGIPVEPFPGDYNGPEEPNYEEYMTSSELNSFYSSPKVGEWIEEQIASGKYTEEDQGMLERMYAVNFMSGENKVAYEKILQEFLDAYVPWKKAWDKYEQCIIALQDSGYEFQYNNSLISPDGKYQYCSVKAGMAEIFNPVRFDTATGKSLLYTSKENITVSSVAADYSVLGHPYNEDVDLYRMAYIFPQGDTTPVAITDYFESQGNQDVYDWMEQHMYQSVVVSVTASGTEQFDDRWCVGIPICTPDMGIIGFGASMLYWQTKPLGAGSSNLITFIVNTGLGQGNGNNLVGTVASDTVLAVLPGSTLAVEGDIVNVTVYDLSGTALYSTSSKGTLATGLPSGLYIVKATTSNGETVVKKAMF